MCATGSGPQRLGGQLPAVGEYRELAALGRDHLAVDEHDVAEVDVGLPRGERSGADPVEGEHRLQLARALAQRGEAELAGVADEDHPAGDTDLDAGLRTRGHVRVGRADLGEGVGARDIDRERRRGGRCCQPVVLRATDAQLLGQILDRLLGRSRPDCLRPDCLRPDWLRHVRKPIDAAASPSKMEGEDTDECHVRILRCAHCHACTISGRVPPMTQIASPPTTGIRLSGLVKSFKTPQGIVRAVRGVDIAIAPGETVALLGPNGAGKSTTIDMLLGLQKPDSGTVSLFGMTPADAIKAGAIGAMLQTGGLPQNLSVRELVTMMASFYPNALDVDEVMAITGVAEIAAQRTDQDLRRSDPAGACRDRAGLQPRSARPRRADGGDGRRGPAQLLERSCARWPRPARRWSSPRTTSKEADAYADRIVLMARGRIVADGPATEIKATVGLRTITATLPGVRVDELALLPGVRKAELRGESIVLSCSDSDSAIRALLNSYPQARDILLSGAGLEEAFLALTGDHDEHETEPAR